MHQISTLKNGLTLITVDLPHLESVTSFVIVGAGSRYETRQNNGISHFLEHMFFKGSKKYPSLETINLLVDSVGAVHNAATSKEFTFYWIKSAANHVDLASDILSSMVKESLLKPEEIEKEKGVIIEEMRMDRDNPMRYIWDLYENLQYGDQPLGWHLIGSEKSVQGLQRRDLVKYMANFYSPKNMALVYVGKLPKNVKSLAEKYFTDLKAQPFKSFPPYKKEKQIKPRLNVHYKKTDQVNLILGVEGYDRNDPKRYAARLLGVILGEGMSSRLFLEIRDKRGLAYHVSAGHEPYIDTGSFTVFGGFKLEKIEEAIEVIKQELVRTTKEKVTEDELKKAKEMIRGRLALRSESTNFLAEYFGIDFVLDRKLETFEEYLKKIDAVTIEDILNVAQELFKPERFNLQIIGPFKSSKPFAKLLF